MFETIEKLRAKSDRTKKQIAFLSALFVTGIIFIVWITVVYPDFKDKQDAEKKVAELAGSPAKSFWATFSDGFAAVGQQFTDIKETISNQGNSAEPTYVNTSSETQ